MQMLKEILDTLLEGKSDVCAIGITGQMHGIVYLDKDGSPVSNLKIWQDGRGNLPYKNGTYASFMSEATGYPLATGYGCVTYFYDKINGMIPENAVSLCTVHDLAAMTLSGKSSPVTHPSDAASLGLYSVKNDRFDTEALKTLGLDAEMLPKVETGFSLCGEYKGIPVAVAIGDNQASFIGSVKNMGQSGLINIGTGAQISCAVPSLPKGTTLDVRPLTDKNYIIAGSALCGGRAYAMLERLFRRIAEEVTGSKVDSAYKMMDRLMENAEIKSPITVDTRFSGTRADPSIRGSITGIGADNFDIETLCDGFMTGMAEELYGLYDEMKPYLGSEMTHMIASGNGVRFNSSLKDRLERVFKAKILIPEHKEEGCFGAMLFALTASGIYPSLEKAQELIKYE
jgi:sedoheptulokinase